MGTPKKGTWAAAWKRMRLNMRAHPASPYMGRAVAYSLLLVFVLIVAIALQESPLRGYAALVAAISALAIMWKIRNALRHANQIMHEDKPERVGLFRGMAEAIKDVKKL